MSSLNHAPDTLCADNLSFRFYQQHIHGVSLHELSRLTGWSEPWIAGRIEAVQDLLERQPRQGSGHLAELCSEQIWADQVWD